MTEPKYCYGPDNETFHTTDFGEFIDSLRSDSDAIQALRERLGHES